MSESVQVLPEAPRKRSRAALWVTLAGVAVVLVLTLSCLGARVHVKRAMCRNQLSSLGIAMHLYADENGADFPTGDTFRALALLYPQYTDNVRIFSCPSAPAHNRGADFCSGGTLQADSTSYLYLPGRDSSCPGPFHLMHDRPGNHGGSFNALRVDSCTEWWPASRAAEFLRRVELENEAVARWRASGRPAEAFGEFISPELQDLMGRPDPELQHGKAMW